ncbi:MAG: hypothetical protein ACTSYR_02600 [Candidatus Odinarchaeia archaeon]
MIKRAIISIIIGLITSFILIYIFVFGNPVTDLLNLFLMGLDNFKTQLLNYCLIQFSAYPLLISGSYTILIPLIITGLLIGVICSKFSTSILVIAIYSLLMFLIPMIILILEGMDILLSIQSILFLFIGSSVVQVLINIIIFEIVISVPSIIGAAITYER